MPWHDPATLLDFTAGEFPTAAKLDRIKDNLAALKATTRAVSVARFAAVAAPTGSWQTLTWQTELFDDWNSSGDFTNFYVAGAGLYTVSVNVVFGGATGSGEVAVRIQRVNSSGVLVDSAGTATAPMNGGAMLTILNNAAAGDFFNVQALSSATGSGHSWTGRLFIKQETAI